MLVISRKPGQRVVLEELGISLEILKIAGNTTRIGIDAPDEIRVLRGELVESVKRIRDGSADRHEIRNRLNTINLALQLLRRKFGANAIEQAASKLGQAAEMLQDLINAETDRRGLAKELTGAPTRRALVVEDNANERELLAGYLELLGFETHCAQDGEAALSMLEEQERLPDVVLLDMGMPRMDGQQTVRAIRRHPEFKRLRLFAVTGMDRNELDIPLGRSGVDRWFRKPIQTQHIASALAAAT